MKAIRVHQHGGPEVLKLEEAPQPDPAKGQVLLQVKAIGVNPVDTYIRAGGYIPITRPYTPGFDAAGVVAAVGPEVIDFAPGDRVYTSGTVTGAYAEFALCDASTIHPLPQSIAFSQGAALGVPYATACRALFHRGKGVAGETVLVHGGSGGVGTAAIQFARAAGLTVFANSSTEAGRKLVTASGAHHALDHSSPNYLQELMRITNQQGVDLVLEMLANVNLGKDLSVLAKFGRVVVIGNRGKVEINPRETMSRDAAILGMTLFNASPAEIRSIHAAIYAGLENQTLRPVVGREMPLAQAAAAQTAVMEHEQGAHGKIILTN
jgi:NADPH2:quinone reductase